MCCSFNESTLERKNTEARFSFDYSCSLKQGHEIIQVRRKKDTEGNAMRNTNAGEEREGRVRAGRYLGRWLLAWGEQIYIS